MGLRKSALGLAAASATEYGLQLAIPVVLVRTLDAATFGQYRFLWLLAATALAWVPLFMPHSLFYFLPRHKEKSAALVTNALLYLVVAGTIVALLCSSLNPYSPEMVRKLNSESKHLSSVFLGLWVVVTLFDVLPTAVGKAHVQAATTAILAVVRSALLVAAALFMPSLSWIVIALVSVAALKLLALLVFIRRDPAFTPMRADTGLLRVQLLYAAPFAFGNALFLMRAQADQWIVASTVDTATYAVFSVASVLAPIATLVRQPLYNAMMPKLNAAYAGGQVNEVAALLRKSNAATSIILVPVVGLLVCIAHELVSFIYTPAYAAAALVMQVYLVGMLANAFAVGHVLPALNLGRFATVNNAVCLACSILVSYTGLHWFGLPGAALGSVMLIYVGELWSGYRISGKLGVGFQHLIQWPSLARLLFAVVLAGAATTGTGLIVLHSLPVQIVVKSLVFVAIYVPAFLLLGGMGDLQAMLGRRAGLAADAPA